MNSGDTIINIKSMKDINNISENTRYINISIDNVDLECIDYLILNGNKYLYSDTISDKNGFIYSNYEMFKYSESIITAIIDNMPCGLNKIEMARYIYISLGKILCTDINVMDEKNDVVSFGDISTINNIWGAIYKRKVGDAIVSKIFMYVCSRLGIKCDIVSSSIKGNIANKVYLDDGFLIIDLYSDIYNIQGGFATKYFDKYNDNKEIDKKILYIKDEYMDYYIDEALSGLDYTKDDTLYEVLSTTGGIIDIKNIGTYELFKIYRNIFERYIPNYDIKINNLFVCGGFDTKKHFALFSYNDNYYSFNYNKGFFVNVDMKILYDNFKKRRIGIYDGEDFDIKEKGMVL